MAGRIVTVFDYQTLAKVGHLELDPTGALLSVDGGEDLRTWAQDNLLGGLVETHSYYHNGCYDRVKAPIPPEDPQFFTRLNMRLVQRGWCDGTLAKNIREHPNFAQHPWRKAHPA